MRLLLLAIAVLLAAMRDNRTRRRSAAAGSTPREHRGWSEPGSGGTAGRPASSVLDEHALELSRARAARCCCRWRPGRSRPPPPSRWSARISMARGRASAVAACASPSIDSGFSGLRGGVRRRRPARAGAIIPRGRQPRTEVPATASAPPGSCARLAPARRADVAQPSRPSIRAGRGRRPRHRGTGRCDLVLGRLRPQRAGGRQRPGQRDRRPRSRRQASS